MAQQYTIGRLDGWARRLDSVVAAVPYVALGMSTLVVVVIYPVAQQTPLWVTLLIVALAAAWMLWMITLHPRWSARRGLMAVYYVVLLVLIAELVLRSPFFGFFAYAGYLHAAYALHGRWRLAGIAATAMITAVSQVGGFTVLQTSVGLAVYLGVALFNVAVAVALTLVAWVTTQQAERRKLMIAELAEAKQKLEDALAENVGLHAQLLEQAREAGVLDERQRMAREIHDTLAQGLTGIVTQLEAAEQARERPADWLRHVRTAARLGRDSLSEARRSVHALRPEALEDARLPDALAEVVAQWSTVNGLSAELVTTGDARPLLPEIEVALLRTAQEALANVAKHANAKRVGLTLSYMEDLITLDVRDDGDGFDPARQPAASANGGYGLIAMRERVHRVAGSLEVESEPGSGTAISACVPAILAGGAR